MLDSPEPAHYYEPWTPKVGQRVVVRISPECDSPTHRIDETAASLCEDPPPFDGRTGVIIREDDHPAWLVEEQRGHRWVVKLDDDGYRLALQLPEADHRLCIWLLTCELEPTGEEGR